MDTLYRFRPYSPLEVSQEPCLVTTVTAKRSLMKSLAHSSVLPLG